MKVFFITLFLSFNLFAANNSELLNCKGSDRMYAGLSIYNTEYNEIGHVSHMFSSANLNCSFQTVRRIENNEDFKCVGFWDFDRDENQESTDTVVIINFVNTATNEWSAEFTTSKLYGNKKIQLDCQSIK